MAVLMVPVVVAGIGMAKADDVVAAAAGGGVNKPCEGENGPCKAEAVLTAKLKEECKLVLEGGNLSACINPMTGNLDAPFTPKFKLITNGAKHKLVLKATDEDNTGAKRDAFAKEGGKDYIALANNKVKPTSAAIMNALGAAPFAVSNDNAIAYTVSSVTMSGASSGNLVFDAANKQFETSAADPAKAGTTFITLTTGIVPRTNTYSDTTDFAGDYKAELTLTAYDI